MPSYRIIDLQSTKTQYRAEERGIDGGKWVKGRKRPIVVDTLGDVLHVQVHAANVPDTKAGCAVLQRTAEKYSSRHSAYPPPRFKNKVPHKGVPITAIPVGDALSN